jgi:hypothetical protein
MKYLLIVAFLILCFNHTGQSQTENNISIDSTLAKKISISGVCLCRTTLSDLQKLNNDFTSVEVEEMDTPRKCYSHDSRYINGFGYTSKQFPGLIFQKESENSDYISKIRLTKDFKGKLPNGAYLELKDLKLKDVFVIYPEFKDKWGSRGCSDYWMFSNDTITFFVKIDKNIQPQFPINKEYYFDKPVQAIDLFISCYSLSHKPVDLINEPGNEPIYFLDSIQVNRGVVSLCEPTEIAAVIVYKDTGAIRIAGAKGKNGVIYIATKMYARQKYWAYFKSKSANYAKAVPSIKKEGDVVYILNGRVLTKDFEGDLYFIDNNNFIDLTMIDKEQLQKVYGIKDIKWGCIIKTSNK